MLSNLGIGYYLLIGIHGCGQEQQICILKLHAPVSDR